MSDISDNKRKLPRHVDGRIMILMMPIKNFFILLPFAATVIYFIVKYFTPVIFFSGCFVLA